MVYLGNIESKYSFYNDVLIPQSWMWTQIGEISKLIRGVTYKKTESSKESRHGYLPILRANNINKELIFDDFVYISQKKIKKEQYIKAYDILIAMSSGSKNLVGKAAQATKCFNGGFGTFCGLVRGFSYFNKKFLGLFFQSPSYRSEISRLSIGVNINNLRREHIETMLFPLPPLPEQHKIVEKIEELFTKLDAGVEALKKIKEQIKKYRQSVSKSAFEGKLTADWRQRMLNDELRILNGKEDNSKLRIDDSELKNLPELPEGWIWTNFDKIADVNPKFNKRDLKGDLEVTFLPMHNVEAESGKMDVSQTKKLSYVLKRSYTYFENGDIIFAKITPCMENGKAAIATNLKNNIGFGSTEFHVVRLAQKLSRNFFFYYMIQEKFRKEAKRSMKGTAGHMRVPTDYIRQVAIVFSPIPEQHKIVEEIEKRFSIADEVERTVNKSLEEAEKLRQSILKKAFEGKLTEKWREQHPELVSGENSAEKLLEKIKEEKNKYK